MMIEQKGKTQICNRKREVQSERDTEIKVKPTNHVKAKNTKIDKERGRHRSYLKKEALAKIKIGK